MGWWSDTVGRCALHGEWNAELAASCPRCVAAACAPRSAPADDARAQLWARVYATELELCRRLNGTPPDTLVSVYGANGVTQTTALAFAQRRARDVADAAVRDFDEHYLGGKR